MMLLLSVRQLGAFFCVFLYISNAFKLEYDKDVVLKCVVHLQSLYIILSEVQANKTSFMFNVCRSCFFVLYLLSIVMFVLLLLTDSDCLFYIFHLPNL